MSSVWEESVHKGSALLLLLAIADHAHDDGTGSYPSIATLARKIRMSERQVYRLIDFLQDSGELIVESSGSPLGTNLYSVVIVGGDKMSGVGGDKMSGGGDMDVRGGGDIVMSDEPSFNHPLRTSAGEDFEEQFSKKNRDIRVGRSRPIASMTEDEKMAYILSLGSAFSKAPAHLRGILEKMRECWTDMYDRMVVKADRRRWIKVAEEWHGKYGEGVVELIGPAAKLHKDRGLSLTSPGSWGWAIEELVYNPPKEIKTADQFSQVQL